MFLARDTPARCSHPPRRLFELAGFLWTERIIAWTNCWRSTVRLPVCTSMTMFTHLSSLPSAVSTVAGNVAVIASGSILNKGS